METLLVGLFTAVAGVLAALLNRFRKTGRSDVRQQIHQDIELRKELIPDTEDAAAREALTKSILVGAQRLTSERPDWFQRWGLNWLLPAGIILFFLGVAALEALEDMEAGSGIHLTLLLIGRAATLIGGSCVGIWIGRVLSQRS